MSIIQVCKNSEETLEIEIRPDKGDRFFWVLWFALGVVIVGCGSYELGVPRLGTLPFWALLILFAVIVLSKGRDSLMWYSRGYEALHISPDRLSYERHGVLSDRKKTELWAGDIISLSVLAFPLGDALTPYTLLIKTDKGSVGIGRNLSKDSAVELRQLIRAMLRQESKQS